MKKKLDIGVPNCYRTPVLKCLLTYHGRRKFIRKSEKYFCKPSHVGNVFFIVQGNYFVNLKNIFCSITVSVIIELRSGAPALQFRCILLKIIQEGIQQEIENN